MVEDAQAIRSQIAATREQMGQTADAIAYRTNVKARTKERISRKVAGVRSTLGLGASQVRSGVGSGVAQVAAVVPSAEDVRGGAQQAVGIAQENPLGLALGSVAIGFIAGLFVPASRVENERLGPIADELKEQVAQTGQEALAHATAVAQDTAAAALDAAEQSGQEHLEQLKESAQESVEQIKETASHS